MTTELKTILGIGLVTLGIFGGAIWWLGRNQTTGTQQVSIDKLITSDSNRIGSTSAKVTLVEFGDYQCPSCAVSHNIVKDLIQTYPTQLSFVFRHFPLSQHPLAPLAAETAEAAGEQGKYWEMHNTLYEHQSEWSSSPDPLKNFQAYATNLNLDLTKFSASIKATKAAGKIQQGLADGMSLNIDATPTFYINGQKFIGSIQTLKQTIQSIIDQN